MTTTLLTTKLYAPPVRTNFVPRTRLTERLSVGLGGKLTLVIAPAGFGKTTVLSAWLDPQSEAVDRYPFVPRPKHVAWVSLDAGDNDATRFWSYVLAALDTLVPGIAAPALALLQAPQPPPLEAILTMVLNGLSGLAQRAVFILDDYHAITSPVIHTSLTFLLNHLPPCLHLVIASRSQPQLPLARLRACGQLNELRAIDLRFTPDETAMFLSDAMGLALTAQDVSVLESRTEGWIAGLQLAALAMRDRRDLAGFIRAFTQGTPGTNRFVMDYLVEEVFASQPPQLQSFLLQTSILDRMCGSLCDAVIGIEQREPVLGRIAYSQQLLEELERTNVFTIALDDERQWYRYHHLFGDVLRSRLLGGAAEGELATLHRRASMWYERQGLLVEAVQHALTSQDWERAARLMSKQAPTMLQHGQVQAVLGWFSLVPATLLRQYPALCLLQATAYSYTNQLEVAERCLEVAEQAVQPEAEPVYESASETSRTTIRGEIAAIRANLALNRNDLSHTIAYAREALSSLPVDNLQLRGEVMVRLGAAYCWSNQPLAGSASFTEAIRLSRAAGDVYTAVWGMFNQGSLQQTQGDLRQAERTYREALQLAVAQGPRYIMLIGLLQADMGELLYEWNELAEAEFHLKEAIEHSRSVGAPRLLVTSYTYLARVQLAQGNGTTALESIQSAVQLVQQHHLARRYAGPVAACQVRLWLAQGNVAAATAWTEASGLTVEDELDYLQEAEHLALARVLIARHDFNRAINFLQRLQQAAEAVGRMAGVIETMALQAIAFHARGDTTQAGSILEHALVLAEPEGYLRRFVDEGAPMAELLLVLNRQPTATALRPSIERVLAGFGAEVNVIVPATAIQKVQPHEQALNERELTILRLIANGCSNREIADKLVIAVSTVKTHINNCYGKLGVHSRTQGIARARELGLL